ncbi:hypothetical protein GCM10011506_44480 [Marivirga lumbricoides]|uniref:SPOR domain-containing protein n=2 Tax=Marivirga lumbricoides TaxID=1046115 RepID=A0ABQ1N7X6_9BACT|nr:hypothetical protein GCM10011506_44480 [Marivirga lumbricoides]
MILYRKQWADIAGAPTTQALTFTSPIKNQRMGVGVYVYNDVVNILGKTGALLAYRYSVPLAKKHQLSFGLAAGLTDSRIYFDRIRAEDPFEESLLLNSERGAYVDGNLGIHYQFKELKIGLAAQQLFENTVQFENTADEKFLAYNLIRHYMITAAYSFRLSNTVTIDPYLLMKSAQGLPSQVDVNAIFKYRENSWLALSYRNNTAAAVSLGTDFEERYTVGYSYEMPINSLAGVGGSTHEVMVGIRFGKSSSSLQGTTVGKDENTASDYKKAVQEQYELIDQLQQSNEVLKKEVEQNKETIQNQKEEIDELKKVRQEDLEEIEKIIEKVKVGEQETGESEGEERKYYAIVGAFKTLKYAKLFQKILLRELNLETSVVQSQRISGVNYFFIYTNSHVDFLEAQKEINNLSRMDSKGIIIGNPWIYQMSK